MTLTSVGDKHGVILRLHILLGALSRQSHTALTGMELAVDLSTGPCKHLTKDKEDIIYRAVHRQSKIMTNNTLNAHAGVQG